MHEFVVHDNVELNTRHIPSILALDELVPKPVTYGNRTYQQKSKLRGRPEADSRTVVGACTTERPMLAALGLGYGQHYAVSITPDSIWLTLVRGLADCIDQDPEGMRGHFVSHQGKVKLEVDATGRIQKGNPGSDWGFTFQAFSEQLQGYLGKKHDLIVSSFSTTTDTDRLASEVTLMGAMKHYFEYKVTLACGFPSIRLEGTPEDWEDIRDRVQALSELGLSWWTSHLAPTIDQFIKASKGVPEVDFWRRAYVEGGCGSGPRPVNGWYNTLYPYVAVKQGRMKRNEFLDWQGNAHGKRFAGGNEVEDFPISLVEAPVELNDNGRQYDMLYYGGLIGCSYDPVGSRVKPVSGWAVQDVTGEEANA